MILLKNIRNIITFAIILLFGSLICFLPVKAQEIKIQDLPSPSRSKPVIVESTQTTSAKTVLAAPAQIPSKKVASLSFAWNTPVNLAAFERNGKIWLVFDHLQQVDVENLKKTAGQLAQNIIQFPHPLATLIQISPAPNVKISIRKEGLLWVADLYTQDLPDHQFQNLTIYTQYDSLKQPYLYIPTEFAGNIISIIDPEIGDIISLAPSSVPDLGVATQYTYPEFEILKTIQGLAFVINAPDIMLTRGNSGLTFRAQGRGLNITSDLDSLKYYQRMKEQNLGSKAFNLQIPQKLQEMHFRDAVEFIKKDIINAPQNRKNKIRLELARYYIYNGLGTNALYILNQMKKAQLPEAQTDDFHALRGIANFLTHRYAEAVTDFEQGTLPERNEGIFWRTLAQSAYEFKEPNNAIIFAHISVIKDYPQEIKDQIALIAAENALKSGDDLAAQNFIDILRSVQDRLRNLTPHINYLAAKKLELQGYPRNAIKEYRNIIHSSSTKYSSLARYENAILSQRINVMPIRSAIAELERLRFAWNEKDFKLNLLDKLAELYLKDFDYHNALRTLNEAIMIAKNEDKQLTLNNKMIRVFEEIFLSNQADEKLSPIKALALYNDFNWLADASSKKNQITQRLADRLVAVDLLPRAYGLLSSLIQKPEISDEMRARVGARMAIINLFEEEPHNAIEILKFSDSPSLSNATAALRRIIMAKALSAMDQTDAALELLKDDYSKNALRLKFEIYWHSKRWSEAADTIKLLVEEPIANQPLSQEQITYILDWATALKQAGKDTILLRLRNKFIAQFNNTKYHSIFNILTNNLEENKIDIKEINTIVNDVKSFTDYAKLYTESLQHSEPEQQDE